MEDSVSPNPSVDAIVPARSPNGDSAALPSSPNLLPRLRSSRKATLPSEVTARAATAPQPSTSVPSPPNGPLRNVKRTQSSIVQRGKVKLTRGPRASRQTRLKEDDASTRRILRNSYFRGLPDRPESLPRCHLEQDEQERLCDAVFAERGERRTAKRGASIVHHNSNSQMNAEPFDFTNQLWARAAAQAFPDGRYSSEQCQWWWAARQPLRKGPWTDTEDRRVLAIVADEQAPRARPWSRAGACPPGTTPEKWQWSQIAGRLVTRTARQCRERYIEYLDPATKHDEYTYDEDLVIMNAVQKSGHAWRLISKELPGRRPNNIKNHWNAKLERIAQAVQDGTTMKALYDASGRPLLNDIVKLPRIASSSKRSRERSLSNGYRYRSGTRTKRNRTVSNRGGMAEVKASRSELPLAAATLSIVSNSDDNSSRSNFRVSGISDKFPASSSSGSKHDHGEGPVDEGLLPPIQQSPFPTTAQFRDMLEGSVSTTDAEGSLLDINRPPWYYVSCFSPAALGTSPSPSVEPELDGPDPHSEIAWDVLEWLNQCETISKTPAGQWSPSRAVSPVAVSAMPPLVRSHSETVFRTPAATEHYQYEVSRVGQAMRRHHSSPPARVLAPFTNEKTVDAPSQSMLMMHEIIGHEFMTSAEDEAETMDLAARLRAHSIFGHQLEAHRGGSSFADESSRMSLADLSRPTFMSIEEACKTPDTSYTAPDVRSHCTPQNVRSRCQAHPFTGTPLETGYHKGVDYSTYAGSSSNNIISNSAQAHGEMSSPKTSYAALGASFRPRPSPARGNIISSTPAESPAGKQHEPSSDSSTSRETQSADDSLPLLSFTNFFPSERRTTVYQERFPLRAIAVPHDSESSANATYASLQMRSPLRSIAVPHVAGDSASSTASEEISNRHKRLASRRLSVAVCNDEELPPAVIVARQVHGSPATAQTPTKAAARRGAPKKARMGSST